MHTGWITCSWVARTSRAMTSGLSDDRGTRRLFVFFVVNFAMQQLLRSETPGSPLEFTLAEAEAGMSGGEYRP
jgi:hypothetical protein